MTQAEVQRFRLFSMIAMHRRGEDIAEFFIKVVSRRTKISFVRRRNEDGSIHGSRSVIQNGIPWIDDRPMIDGYVVRPKGRTDTSVAKTKKRFQMQQVVELLFSGGHQQLIVVCIPESIQHCGC